MSNTPTYQTYKVSTNVMKRLVQLAQEEATNTAKMEEAVKNHTQSSLNSAPHRMIAMGQAYLELAKTYFEIDQFQEHTLGGSEPIRTNAGHMVDITTATGAGYVRDGMAVILARRSGDAAEE